MRTGAHEEGVGWPGAGVTGGCEHLMWVLGTKCGSPARAVCAPLTTEPSLQCLSFILTVLRIKPKALYTMNKKNPSIYCKTVPWVLYPRVTFRALGFVR